jgi:hypothetical protein
MSPGTGGKSRLPQKMRELKRVTDLTSEGGTIDIWERVRQGEFAEHLRRARTVKYGDELEN